MKPELPLIKSFCNYEHWLKYNTYISATDIHEDLRYLYRCLDAFHKSNEEGKDLSVADLSLLVFSNNPKNKEFLEEVLNNLDKISVELKNVVGYINAIHQTKIYRELALSSYSVSEGKDPPSKVEELLVKLKELEPVNGEKEPDDEMFVSVELQALIDKTVSTPGLRWRLDCLNKSLGSLRKGNFGFIFARPESGKTTFLASEASHMLTQTDRVVLWLNNEQEGEAVMLRIYQAFFGVTLAELLGNVVHFSKEFQAATNGRFKLLDSAQISKAQVEKLCKKYDPGLIIVDQIDKIKGFDADREDLRLGAIYIWARELAKQYGPVIGVCQADGTGENVRYLTMSHVANAKTSKQAEADWILGIGCIHDTGWERVRFLNISKNKLMGDSDTDPKLRHSQFSVLIEPEIARYKDLKQ